MFWMGSLVGFLLGFIGGIIFVFEKIENIIHDFGDIEIEKIEPEELDEEKVKEMLGKKNKED